MCFVYKIFWITIVAWTFPSLLLDILGLLDILRIEHPTYCIWRVARSKEMFHCAVDTMTSWFTDQTLSWVTKSLSFSSVPLCHKLWQKATNQPSANEMEQWMKRKWNVQFLIPIYIPSALALWGQLLLSKTIHLEEEKRERDPPPQNA